MKIDGSSARVAKYILGDDNILDLSGARGALVAPARGRRLLQSDGAQGPWRRCGKAPTKRYVRAVKI